MEKALEWDSTYSICCTYSKSIELFFLNYGLEAI